VIAQPKKTNPAARIKVVRRKTKKTVIITLIAGGRAEAAVRSSTLK
jgi:hypothetical protein